MTLIILRHRQGEFNIAQGEGIVIITVELVPFAG